jgi:uncharacterized protein YwqG
MGKPAVQLIGTVRVTSTFFGGLPQVSFPLEWPCKEGRSLAFLGQIELSDISLQKAAPWLPSSGRLLFFYNTKGFPWGFDPKDKGGWAVLHDAGSQASITMDCPSDLPEEYRLSGVKHLEGKPFLSIPNYQRISLDEAGISEEEEDEYRGINHLAFDGNPAHQIGGYPEPLQADKMEEECQLASAGIHCADLSALESVEAERIRLLPNDWKLLLQFDSDDDIGAMWGDAGRLYVWIRESDARKGNFEDAWIIVQC